MRYSLLDLNGALILGIGLGMLACFSLEYFFHIRAGGPVMGIIAAATVGIGSIYGSSMRTRARSRSQNASQDTNNTPKSGDGDTSR